MKPLDRISYRKAVSEDIDTLSKLHLNTFKNSLGTSVGLSYVKAFFKWFVLNDSTIVISCYKSERIIGYAIGAIDGYSKKLTKSILPNIILGILSHPKAVLHPNFLGLMKIRIRNLFKTQLNLTTNANSFIEKETNSIPFVLVGIGIDPEFRMKNLGAKLLANFENEAWCAGFKKIRLTVYKSNVHAIKFYEKANWILDSENETTLKYIKTRSDTSNN